MHALPLLFVHASAILLFYFATFWLLLQQTVREATQYAPVPVRRILQPIPYTPYACGAQRPLRYEYS